MPSDPQTAVRLLPSATPGIEPMFAKTTRTFVRHFHDQFGIGVVLSGAQRSASGRGQVEAERGDVITVNPGEIHDGVPIDKNARAWAMLYLDPDRVGEIAIDLSEGRSADIELANPVQTDPIAASFFRRAFRSMVRAQEHEATAENLVLLVNRLSVQKVRVNSDNIATAGLRHAQQAIDDDPAARHSLMSLASVANVGQFHLIRGFATQTGMTPHAYTVQRRLQLARRLLRKGLSLAHTSAEAGFADQSHMTRLFARSYGITPGAYAQARS